MADQTILIIRHGEKPLPGDDAGGDAGVDEAGHLDPRSLTPRGWQRAGAWVQLFVPPDGLTSNLPSPTKIYASAPEKHRENSTDVLGSKSRRPLETVTPLATKLGIDVDESYTKGQESEIAAAISRIAGVVLVCWQHEAIKAIVKAMVPLPGGIPTADWPNECFNVIYRFDRSSDEADWIFKKLSPVMLSSDQGP